MRFSIIAAMARNRVIGVNNGLPWRLPEDLQHFKALTLGHPVLMGRKTWESLPGRLPGRTNVVITRNPSFHADGCVVVNSLDAAIAACAHASEAFCIGGAELYGQALEYAARLYLTEIQDDFPGDARFPDFDRTRWRETAREIHRNDAGLEYHFVTYDRT
jgi:dihydrofolate reductase